MLKVLLWAALAATLIAGIWDVATGGQAGPPTVLIWTVVVLIGLQAITLFAWYRLWKARLRKGKS